MYFTDIVLMFYYRKVNILYEFVLVLWYWKGSGRSKLLFCSSASGWEVSTRKRHRFLIFNHTAIHDAPGSLQTAQITKIFSHQWLERVSNHIHLHTINNSCLVSQHLTIKSQTPVIILALWVVFFVTDFMR